MKSRTLFHLILITFLASLIPAMHAQTFSVIYSFTGGTDGAFPSAGVTIRGNALYGTTGGEFNCGTVYQLTHSGSNWLLSTLAGLSDPQGCGPRARVVFGPDGHLYGTTYTEGKYNYLYGGTVFKLTPQSGPCKDAACYWTVNDLHDFGPRPDGQQPGFGDLIWDQQGNIYGTTVYGGAPDCGFSGCGIVYELTLSGNGYTENVIYNFSLPDGVSPYGGLVFDNQGNLFGTTYGGSDAGTVFELTYVPGVGWTEHVLYNFQGPDDGAFPVSGLIIDSSGNLYGTTPTGGSGSGGTVFELSPSGDTWTFKVLYSFSAPPGQFYGPQATLSMDEAGNLYGTTFYEGIYNLGSVFKLSNTQNGWVYTSLHDFTGLGTDGAFLRSNVAIDTDGTLYGTTLQGGDRNCNGGAGCGIVWMIKP